MNGSDQYAVQPKEKGREIDGVEDLAGRVTDKVVRKCHCQAPEPHRKNQRDYRKGNVERIENRKVAERKRITRGANGCVEGPDPGRQGKGAGTEGQIGTVMLFQRPRKAQSPGDYHQYQECRYQAPGNQRPDR